MKLKILSLAIVAVNLSACMTFSAQDSAVAPIVNAPEKFLNSAADMSMDEEALYVWWKQFDDDVLATMVEIGLSENLDIEIAGARLRQARASLKAEKSNFWPSISGSQSVSRSRDFDVGQSSASTYQAGFDASYEVDLFGGVRNSVKAANAEVENSEADLHAIQLTVCADIALYYIDARAAQTRLLNTRATLQSQSETLQIVKWRQRAGLVSSLDLEQAKQLYSQTSASIPPLENNYRGAMNRLAILLGLNPGGVDKMLATEHAIPIPPSIIATGLPTALLQRRPDVYAAERTVLAETARVGIRRAELLPSLRLSGKLSVSDVSPVNLLDASLGSILASIAAPIFNGGRLRARLAAQQASAHAAVITYRKTVLTAFEETENAISTFETTQRRSIDLVDAETAAKNAVLLARSQYKAGLIGFDRLLETERTLLSAQDSVAVVNADKAKAAARLFKALGGGWQQAPTPHSVNNQPM
jgi:outer membrane protein, multidrug efflux system